MSKLIMTKGLPGSGKTTWANQYADSHRNVRIVCKDDIRADRTWNEKQVILFRDSRIKDALHDNRDVISSDTNFNPIHEKRLRELAHFYGADFEIQDFTDVPLSECIKRDLKRPRSVGEKVIREMHNKYIRPTLNIEQDVNLPFAIICDLDSTLALMGDRNPYDASDCEYDKLNEPVWNAVRKYLKDGYKLIIFSGRSSKYLEQTDRWLGKHGIHPDVFSMRKEGDDRKDYIVKKEMFMQHVYGKYYVEVVFDDREQVIDMYRDLGLTVFDVAGNKF